MKNAEITYPKQANAKAISSDYESQNKEMLLLTKREINYDSGDKNRRGQISKGVKKTLI